MLLSHISIYLLLTNITITPGGQLSIKLLNFQHQQTQLPWPSLLPEVWTGRCYGCFMPAHHVSDI